MIADTDTRFSNYRETRRFTNLDGLRFICISMVLWHHAHPIPDSPLRFLDLGFLGVDFFFVLSGFLITTLLQREAEQDGKFSLRNFYIRRILRIIPVYFFVVSCVCFYYVVVDGQNQLLKLVPYYYLFLSNFLTDHVPLLSITWSLSVEEQYYLVWPLLLLVLPYRALVPVGLGLVALNVLGAMGVLGQTPPALGPLVFALPNATYAPIILGSLLAMLLNSRRGFAVLNRFLGHRWAAFAGFALLVLLMQFAPADIRGLPNLVIHLCMTAILAALVIREDNSFLGFLKFPLVARIGVVSYGLYLYHLIGLDVANRILFKLGVDNLWAVFVFYYIVSFVVSEISFRTLEAYFQSLRPKLAGRRSVKPAPNDAVSRTLGNAK